MRLILKKLAARAGSRQRPISIIYTERLLLSGSYEKIFSADPALRKTYEAGLFGQAFWVYQCGSHQPEPAQSQPRSRALA